MLRPGNRAGHTPASRAGQPPPAWRRRRSRARSSPPPPPSRGRRAAPRFGQDRRGRIRLASQASLTPRRWTRQAIREARRA
ncbi:hypothetical protein FDP22_14095 [Paroceanicella profunda]|uniref:Uncharacterized protein n=1 Tax=Paroceanicella profunda TaxID=2579971 RepID=A0A5B8G2H1_9RHOB|nr:hypothetical protein FDP22_14095 [Paroceanicella profunda]